MDPHPPAYVHHSRYVPISSSNPNFYVTTTPVYHHHHHNHHHLPPPPPPLPPPLPPPPPPPPPAPPQLHHHPLPAPPPKTPFTSHNSQFTFNPNFNPNPNPKPNNNNPNPNLRIPLEAGRNHYHRHRLLWDPPPPPPRIVPEHRTLSPFRSIEELRHDLEPNYRFRDRERYKNDGFAFEHRTQNHPDMGPPRRTLLLSDSEKLNSASYSAPFNDTELMRLDRQTIRERELIESQKYGDGVRVISGKREFHHWYGNNRGSRERDNSYEFNRTPRKQIQKKSALLRIQKPFYRNRDDDEHVHYSAYIDERNSDSYRDKHQFLYSDHRVDEEQEERKGSPVELDVSFKSNSLVAKAIIAPSSSSVVSDTNLTPKSVKIRKFKLFSKDSSSSLMNKLSESNMMLDSSEDVNIATCSSEKDLKLSEEKISPGVIHNMHDDNSQPSSSGINDPLSNFTMERSKRKVLDTKNTEIVSSKTLLPTVTKKKRVVNLKLKHPDTHVSSLLPHEKVDKSVKRDGSIFNAPAATRPRKGKKNLKGKITSAGRASVRLPCPNEVTMSLENEKCGGSPHTAMLSGEVSTDVNLGSSCVTKIKRKRSSLISPVATSHQSETKFDEGPEHADNCIRDLLTISDTDKDLTKSLNEIIVCDTGSAEGVSKQFHHNGESLMVENSAKRESPEMLLSVGRDISSDLLNSGEKKKHEDHVDMCSFAHQVHAATNFDDSLVCLQGKISNQVISSVDTNIVEGIPLAILPARTSEMSALPSLEEIRSRNVSIHSNCSNHDRGSDYIFNNSEENNLATGDYVGKQLSLEQITSSVENDAKEGLPNTWYRAGGCEENMPKTTNNSKVTTSLFPDGTLTDPYTRPVNAVSLAECVDITCVHTTAGLSVKDFNSAKAMVTCSLDIGLQPSSDSVTVLHESNLTCGFSEGKPSVNSSFIDTSPEKSKRTEVSSSHPGFTNAMISEISEGPAATDLSMSGVEMATKFNAGLMLPEQHTEVSMMDTLCNSDLPHCLDKTQVLCEDSSEQVSSEVVVSVGTDAFRDRTDGLKIDRQRSDSENSDIPNATPGCPPGNRGEQTANVIPVLAGTNDNNEDMDIESKKKEKMNEVAGEEQVMTCVASQLKSPSQHPSLDSNERLPGTYVDSNEYLLEKDDLPSDSAYMALAAHGDGVSTTNSNDEMMGFDTLSDIGTPEILFSVPVMQSLTCKASPNQFSNEVVSGDDTMPNENPVIEGSSNLSASSQSVKIDLKSHYAPESPNVDARRGGSLTSQSTSHNLNLRSGGTNGKKNQPSHSVSKTYPSHQPFVFASSKNTASSTHITKPLTWHRSDKSSVSPMPGNKPFSHAVPKQNQFSRKAAKFQSMSYVRKGNSLVRKPAPVAALPQVSHALPSSVHRLTSSAIGDLKKISGSDSRADDIETPNVLRTGGVGALVERPRTPPLPIVTKVKNCTANSSNCDSSLLAEPLPNSCSVTTSDPQKFVESNDVPNSSSDALKISETTVNQMTSVNSLESQGEPNDGTLSTSNLKKITYVKRKSNQLVAASSHCELPVQNADKKQGFSSDGYYKRRKNQLIRSSVESHINQTVVLPDNILLSEGKTTPKGGFRTNCSKRQSCKVMSKISRPSRFSLVWTQSNMQPKKINDHSSNRPKIMPYLIPWKRAGYWRCFMQNLVSTSNNGSLSAISRKLLLLRKRDAIYTRSGHGFSLRKSKVLSVGGSSLKWSKSIERRSKKANEEATLAVAAVGRKQSEQNGAKSIASRTKTRSHSSRERIFRIGSDRYKMDSTRRTLQRISDDELSHSAAPNLGKNAKRSYIPRRLVIGNHEYVRIGNGNQLVRDPKKRTRALAIEKVRWSLHTARLRLARKRKYCQFFTRFGKCNKNDGKCPYIHDPSKVAVCTKFLNGLCSNSDCKLTHKVIPERMPDCSYFLQGLCTNKGCPYRHVHVNPNSSTCKGFLKGYCADGNECRKKHSYVCPIFEATGSCPQGTKCKLHHPKGQRKGKKRKQSRERKNSGGRYFGSLCMDDSDQRTIASERQSEQDKGDIICEGKFADYITLAISGDEAGETNDAMNEQTILYDSDNSDFQLDDLDEVIKPIRIMN